MTVQELVTSWGFDIDAKPLEGLQERIESVKDHLATAVKYIAAAEAALAALVYTTIQEQKAFAALAFDTGIAVEKLQNHARAAQLAGVPLETYTGAIRSLSQHLNELAINPMSDAAVKMRFMGIQTHDTSGKILDATDVLIQFGQKLDQMTDKHKRAAYAQAILGAEAGALMPFLSRTKEGIGALLQEARQLGLVLSEEDHKAILKTGEILNWFKMAAIGLKNQLVTGLNPAILQAAAGFKAWYVQNQAFIKAGLVETLKGLVWIMGLVAAGIATTISAVKWIVDLFGGWERAAAVAKIALMLIATTIAVNLTMAALAAIPALLQLAAAWITAMAPAIALAGLIVLIGLALEDVITYFNGGDSAIGAFIASLQEAGGWLETIGNALEYVFKGHLGEDLFDAFEAVSEAIGSAWEELQTFTGYLESLPAKAFKAIKAIGTFIIETIREAVGTGIGLLASIPSRFKDMLKTAIFGGSSSPASSPGPVARGPIGQMTPFSPGAFSPAGDARAAAARYTATGGNVQINLKSESKIEGVTDPKEAAQLTAAAQDRMMRGHLANLQRTASDAAAAPTRY